MNLEELRDVRRTERERDGLQSLPDSFYRDVASYLADLKAGRERAAEAADDPFADPEVRRLTEEIETAEEVVESIYERRVGKVVDRASFAAADMRHDTDGLTAEERDLFDDLAARIERNRDRVLDALDPDAGADANAGAETGTGGGTDAGPDARAGPGEAEAEASEGAPDPNDLLAEAMGGTSDDATGDDRTVAGATPDGAGTTDGGVPSGVESESSESAGSGRGPEAAPDPETAAATATAEDGAGRADGDDPDPDRRTVYVTRDVGEILGVDERTYRVEAEDVVDLPADNARALVERDAAEPLE